MIRKMTLPDVEPAVRVHLDAFPGFFLSFLGPGFLRELYGGIVRDDAGIAYVAEVDGACVGFLVGTAQPASFYKRLLKKRLIPFAFHAALATLRKPSVAPRLLRAFRKPAEAPPATSGRAEMMSLAVSPRLQQGGLGRGLIEAFLRDAEGRGATSVSLTTDAVGNDAVNAYYVRRGFRLDRTFVTPEGRKMNEYVYETLRNTR